MSPLWVAHTEKQIYGTREFIRAFLVPNMEITNIQALTFSFTTEFGTVEQVSQDIKPITNTEVKHALFGALVEVPYTMKDQAYDMRLVEIILGERTIDLRDERWGPLHFEEAFEESKQNRFLQAERNFYAQMPVIADDYWQCTCMKYNHLTSDACENCGSEFTAISKMLEWGRPRVALAYYLKAKPVPTLIGTNWPKVWEQYSKELKEAIEVDDALLIARDTKEQCRKIFVSKIAEQLKIKPPKLSIIFKVLGVSILALLALSAGIVASHYVDGFEYLDKGDYALAISEFEAIGGAVYTEDLLNEATFLFAKDLRKDDRVGAILFLEDLAQKNYKDSERVFQDTVYELAQDLFEQGQYEAAAEQYIKIDYRDSKTQYREAYYRLANELIQNPNTYPQAIEAINQIAKMDYKDASTLANEWQYLKAQAYETSGQPESAISIYLIIPDYKDANERVLNLAYEQGIERYNNGEYSGAITYLEMAGKTKDAPLKLIDATYLMGLDYYNQEDYLNAYSTLNKYPEYKDARSLIKRIEDVHFRWEVTIFFNSSENGITDEVTIKNESPFYIHFTVSGGMPDQTIKPKVVYTYPDGDTDVELFDEAYTDESNWIGWDTGLYVDPKIAPPGTFYVEIYDSVTGKFIGSDSVELIK